MNRTRRHTALIVCALLGTGLLAGAAAAGNPHGTPPGQAKKAQSSSTSQGTAQATKTSSAKTNSGKAHQPNSSSSSSSAGVKPSSTTQHNTHAAAGSNQTKLYGNGKTAGEIAMQNGASSSTDLYGPGNSQPHKVAVCSKNGKTHYVDVHALKAHSSSNCTSGGTTTDSSNTTQTVVISGATHQVSKSSIALLVHSGVLAATHTSATSASTPAGGVLGARHTLSKRVAGQSKAAHAVVRSASFTG